MAKRKLSLVVLAAGMGSRFGGVKQIEPVGPSDEILLDYSVFDAVSAGFSHIIFVVRDEVEAVLRERLSPELAGRCGTDFVLQRLDDLPSPHSAPSPRVRPWGTGHAVLACRDLLVGPFAVVNADDFYGADAFRRVARFLSREDVPAASRNALVGYALAGTLTEHGVVSRGVCEVDGENRLTSIVERHGVGSRIRGGGPGSEIGYQDDAGWHAVPRDAIASMNFWGLDPSLCPLLEREFRSFLEAGPSDQDEFRLPSAIGQLIDRGEAAVHVLRTESTWLGVTHRDDLEWVRRSIRARVAAGEYPSPLWRRDGA